jgi:predicted HTH transcriptional regulator
MIESYGTGIPKMVTSCKEAKLPGPQFIEDNFYFKVIFSRGSEQIAPKTKEDQIHSIISVISDGNGHSYAEISELTMMPLSRVKKHMADLQKEGRIKKKNNGRDSGWNIRD